MEILFSQGPTAHNRLANSLLWMARAYPDLAHVPAANVLFPWGRENFGPFFDPRSPWLARPAAAAAALFLRATGTALTAQALAAFARELEAAEEARRAIAPFSWRSLQLRQRIEGVDLVYLAGPDLPFVPTVAAHAGADLVIVHEPFLWRFAGPLFPQAGLEHLAPSAALLSAAIRRQATLNPEGRRACGLHIRRGDYAQWMEGVYLYGDAFWQELCDRLIAAGCHVSVFTHDPHDPLCDSLQALGAHLSAGSPFEDMVRMMQMDQVIGPPSTFPLMASLLARSCQGRSVEHRTLPALGEQVDTAVFVRDLS